MEEVLKLRGKELEGAKSNPREKKQSKKLAREVQEVPEEFRRHDPKSLSTDYGVRRNRSDVPSSSQNAPEEFRESRHEVRRGPEEFPRGAEELRNRS